MTVGVQGQASGRSNFVVTGAGPFSLGDAVVRDLSSAAPHATILAIDAHPVTTFGANVVARGFDLNPFDHAQGFAVWTTELSTLVTAALSVEEPGRPVRGVLLGAARYHVGTYESTTPAIRADVLGSNIVGKWEALHSVMRYNVLSGFENGEALSVFDVGGLHGLHHTSHRALYNPSKVASLALCRVLSTGSEVRRAVHVAPGPIDTPMLHWNHWVLKENGDPQFLRLVKTRLPSLYSAIFRSGDDDAFKTAIRELRMTESAERAVFERYLHRRKVLSESEQGITTPESLGTYVASLMLASESTESGIVEVTSPQGRLRTFTRPFSHAALDE